MKKFWLFGILMLVALPLLATSIVYVSNEDSIRLSEKILVGRVVSVQPGYDAQGQIVRNVSIYVQESLKGNVKIGDTFTFQAWGGKIDGINDKAIGEANYKVGEKVLVQLEKIDSSYHTLGLSFGKWNVLKDSTGKEKIKRDLTGLAIANAGSSRVAADMDLSAMRGLVKKVENGK